MIFTTIREIFSTMTRKNQKDVFFQLKPWKKFPEQKTDQCLPFAKAFCHNFQMMYDVPTFTVKYLVCSAHISYTEGKSFVQHSACFNKICQLHDCLIVHCCYKCHNIIEYWNIIDQNKKSMVRIQLKEIIEYSNQNLAGTRGLGC